MLLFDQDGCAAVARLYGGVMTQGTWKVRGQFVEIRTVELLVEIHSKILKPFQ